MTASIALRSGKASAARSPAKVAGFTYVGAWIVGLTAVWAPGATRPTPRSADTSPTIAC
jgi:hypothetical protein